MEEQNKEMFESMKQLLTAIYNLSFANPLVTIMEQLKESHILQAVEAYGGIFDNHSVSPYFQLFVSSDEQGRMRPTNFGKALGNFASFTHSFLDDDDVVARINSTFGLKLSNPLKDLVYTATQQLQDDERRVLRIAAESPYVRFETLQSQAKSRFDLELSIDQLKHMNERMQMFLLTTGDFIVKEELRKHVLEETKDLGESNE